VCGGTPDKDREMRDYNERRNQKHEGRKKEVHSDVVRPIRGCWGKKLTKRKEGRPDKERSRKGKL